ncbi:hypothetical protein NIES4073_26450 [Kalymmatonema gypsitolerans NIES-4073]|uniref:hypothetical protein n=1 Tax=Scytonema sp. PRP1 TaxID=3120513 RepID=UPI000B602705|nr:hypothetical protein NIES4073_26450 [Scytonema sp. NIES-4073]
MKYKAFAALAIVAAVVGIATKVNAQSSATPNSKAGDYTTIRGNSLTGINNRTAEDDFARFFAERNSQNSQNNVSQQNVGENISPADAWQLGDQIELRRREPITTPNNLIFPQGEDSFYSNDGVQVQIDLDNLNRNTRR